MSNTYTQILYHIVFSTKHRERVLTTDRREELFRYVWGINKNLDCHLHRINGVEDHIHILTSLHPALSLADYVKEIKTGCSKWIKAERMFPGFTGWQDGYGAFTLSVNEKEAVMEYIKRQEEHHRTVSFLEEYRQLMDRAGVKYDERYL